jgi:uncharacterized protein (TIGR02600 family)
MKTQKYRSNLKTRNQQSGVALVIVLSMIVLLSAIMVAFMSRVSTEGRSAKLALQGFEARQAAETAVNLVISQLRAATYDSSKPARAWASQPGAIRTFERGRDTEVYKLYSASKLVDSAADYNPASAEEAGMDPSDLSETPNGYVNLNEPVIVPVRRKDGTIYYEAHFPIADPRANRDINGAKVSNPGTGVVKGFHSAEIDAKNSKKKDVDGKEIPSLPMNVRWLFQLRDGTLVPGVADGDNKLKIEGASKLNPPVSRIAFWTDDDSCKVNLNTASENTYWDTPHATSEQESGRTTNNGQLINSARLPSLSLSASQPTSGEYQRFPGHPATTSLSPVLRWLFPETRLFEGGPQFTEQQYKEAIYRLAPRIRGGIGSSMGATRNPLFPDTDHRVFERDRLFSTVEEYFFRPDRSPMNQESWYHVYQTEQDNDIERLDREGAPSLDFANPYFTPEALERMRFFLTTSSRAPEVNLFGLPRMSIWPINSEEKKRSSYDRLIAFCSTIGGDPTRPTVGSKFYFQRQNPWSGTIDMASGPAGARNQALYNYLFRLMDSTHPAGGGKFTEKYPKVGGVGGAAQILTEMFDYIRSTNLIDTHGKIGNNTYPLAYTPSYGVDTGDRLNTPPRGHPGAGQVVPLKVTAPDGSLTKGFGRFPTVAEVAVIFYFDGTVTSQAAIDSGALLDIDENFDGTDTRVLPIRCALAVEMFTPSPGFPMLAETYAMSVSEDAPFELKISNGATLADPPVYRPMQIANQANLVNYVDVNAWRAKDGRFFMPTRGFWNQMMYESSASATSASRKKLRKFTNPTLTQTDLNKAYESYPFVSKRFALRSTGANAPSSFTVKPGQFKIRLHPVTHSPVPLTQPNFNVRAAADLSPASVIQTFTVDFRTASNKPEWTLPAPTQGGGFLINRTPGTDANPFPEDTVRSMEIEGATKGDYRISGGLLDVPKDMFVRTGTAANFDSATVKQVHNFRSSWGRVLSSASPGKLVVGESPRDKRSKVPFTIQTGVRRTGGGLGDFDRGISKNTDGAFINKPDEGNTRFDFTDDYAGGGAMPYYRGGNGYEEVGESYFTPNRLVSSAVMFGSLPTGIAAKRPWETLLFSPGPKASPTSHKGAVTPRDHYLLDLFHMPIVEPYAISEPLSTAGKVNINCKIAPFGYYSDPGNSGHGYIERYTGIHALLTGVYQFIARNETPEMGHGEQPLTNANTSKHQFRLKLDPDATVNKALIPLLDAKGGYFKSASEICELDLLTVEKANGVPATSPDGYTDPANRDLFWESRNALTGDNQRERPYAHIYPRTTTKSNVFTVHIWAQSLAKSPTGDPEVWNPLQDSVTGEYRGTSTIERYIDPNDSAFKTGDYQDPALGSAKSLEPLYRYRIVNSKAFSVRE